MEWSWDDLFAKSTQVPQTTNSAINFTMFLGTVQVQMGVYSYIGEKLLNCVRNGDFNLIIFNFQIIPFKSTDVVRTLWYMDWYEQPVWIQKQMIQFIMMQAQNNKIALSASSVLNIGYESYLKYVKTSFQILCLLQSFYV